MTVWVALLRAVNVGGRSMKMAELVALCADLGLAGARTYLQTGNLIFSAKGSRSAVAAKIEAAVEKKFGYRSEAILRSAADLGKVIAGDPFPAMARDDPAHLVVSFLAALPGAADEAALEMAWDGPERWKLVGSDLFISYPAGIGTSKLKLKLRTPMTARNWNVVSALAKMSAESAN